MGVNIDREWWMPPCTLIQYLLPLLWKRGWGRSGTERSNELYCGCACLFWFEILLRKQGDLISNETPGASGSSCVFHIWPSDSFPVMFVSTSRSRTLIVSCTVKPRFHKILTNAPGNCIYLAKSSLKSWLKISSGSPGRRSVRASGQLWPSEVKTWAKDTAVGSKRALFGRKSGTLDNPRNLARAVEFY